MLLPQRTLIPGSRLLSPPQEDAGMEREALCLPYKGLALAFFGRHLGFVRLRGGQLSPTCRGPSCPEAAGLPGWGTEGGGPSGEGDLSSPGLFLRLAPVLLHPVERAVWGGQLPLPSSWKSERPSFWEETGSPRGAESGTRRHGLLVPSPLVPQGLWRLRALSEALPPCPGQSWEGCSDHGGERRAGPCLG